MRGALSRTAPMRRRARDALLCLHARRGTACRTRHFRSAQPSNWNSISITNADALNSEILPPEPSRDMRISNARFDCGCRPIGDAGCASSAAPQASGRPPSARVLPRPVRRAGSTRARPYARRATARRPFPPTPHPPRCLTHLPHQHPLAHKLAQRCAGARGVPLPRWAHSAACSRR